ncbi:unnamed protein product [Cuscuta campestris]|uniref:Zinc knuckle CX2CX4HX4C domain-containing protein n=1 Tax=Cuscuta campestris TaxID=132261 RepID=A0A484KLG2_9ASTE|nr:unnamed protein product [Cuscuta campestris]
MIGQPMTIDAATTTFSRPSLARVCVELDLTKDNPKVPFGTRNSNYGIGIEDFNFNSSVWHIFQKVIYEELKAFCTTCKKTGHSNSDRKKVGKKTLNEKNPQIPLKPAAS